MQGSRAAPSSRQETEGPIPRARDQKIATVTVNEQAWQDFDRDGEWIAIPGSLKEAAILIRYQ